MTNRILTSRIGRALLLVLGVSLSLAGGLAWFAGSEPALRWASQQAQDLSGGQLLLKGVQGSLYGPVQVDELSFATEAMRITLKDLRLDWSPRALWRKHLQVDVLTVKTFQFEELKASSEAPQLPPSLKLPVSLSLPKVQVERIVLKTGGVEQVLSQLVLALDKPHDTYELILSRLTTPWGRAEMSWKLSDAAPYALSGQARLQQEKGSLPYQMQATLAGSLQQLVLKAKANAAGGQAEAEAWVTPFEKQVLQSARLEAREIDPSRLGKGLPQAQISALVTLKGLDAGMYAGTLKLLNDQPGTVDKARLPLRSLTASFSGTVAQAELSDLMLDLAQAGRFEGRGQIRNERLNLSLKTQNFKPQGLHARLKPMQLTGDIQLEADAGSQQVLADLRYQRYQLKLDVAHRDDALEVRQALLRSDGGRLALHGKLGLSTARRFELAGSLENFDPAAFGDYPVARVNAAFSGTGRLAGEPEATLQFTVADSSLRRQPLSGKGRLSLSAKRLWDSDLTLRLAHNQLAVRGALGEEGDALAVELDAGNLAELDGRLAGRLRAQASITGRFASPAGRFELSADDLRWQKDYRVGSLRTSGRLDKGLDGLLALNANAREVRTPDIQLQQFSLKGQGRRTQHVLQLSLKNAAMDLQSRLQGGWHDEAGWTGQILSLDNQGPYAFKLDAPARLELAKAKFLLGNARLHAMGAVLSVHELAYKAGQLASNGNLKGLAVKEILQLAKDPGGLKTDLMLDGEWNVTAAERVDGRISLWRDKGDVQLPVIPVTALGLDQLRVTLAAVDSKLRGTLDASGGKLGRLSAEASSVLTRQDGVWGLAGSAPLQTRADLSVDSLAWLAPLLDKTGGLILDGALHAQVRGSGSLAQPRLGGVLKGERFKLELPEQGMQLRDGQFLAELADDVLQLKSLTLQGGKGSLSGQGQAALEAGVPSMQVALKADKLEIFSRPDRLLILSGSGEASWVDKRIQVQSSLKVDQGLMELPKGDAPSASDDVVVLGQEQAAVRQKSPYAIRFDLDMDLGERFYLKGRGLDAQLGGAVKLVSVEGGLPRSSGSIRIVKGTYAAYGQRLDIERGILNFQGPVDNPGLNIVAMRKNQEVEAGVAISGTAQAPSVKLVSNPSVPDSEKLSWLVLGHGVETSSGQEFSVLQTAAGALLAAGESVTLQQRIAQAAGLEEVSLRGAGTLEGTVLTLGKRLSSRAYLSYEQGLSGAQTLAKINYMLTPRISVRAQAGTVPAVDLFYTFSFD
ncbi:MAG: translocation/assembly module TamB domain-containing protein [Gammaproteobacteria bacterium]|nr:translocation/assembly module TamB domain-containing protein [Gammaproteobacteria bacterium]MBU0785645.1 translocation/assembly module TamB domain-containing protein [Gammaproteobacteria bacterium]MBU0816934.1 translocation/assembly module TamB domain-containing protein [Gammaproteobacteria bacterium]MBU1787098.1 translocation/assembly module TamB domain-containing protein [Gammaproteobacteria bacterium]